MVLKLSGNKREGWSWGFWAPFSFHDPIAGTADTPMKLL